MLSYADNMPVVMMKGLEPREFNKSDTKFTLQCQAWGVPPPVFTWFKDGVNLETQVTSHHLANDITVSELKRTRISNKDDSGLYKCLASNSAGEANSSAIVSIQGIIYFTTCT